MADVFLSYASEDREQVRQVHAALEAEGFGVFWDQEIRKGDRFNDAIRRELALARAVVVLWTSESIKSDFVKFEAKTAKDWNKLVPVLFEDLPMYDLPADLREFQLTRLAAWGGDVSNPEWIRLIEGLKSKVIPGLAVRDIEAQNARVQAAADRQAIFETKHAEEVRAHKLTKDTAEAAARDAKEQLEKLRIDINVKENANKGLEKTLADQILTTETLTKNSVIAANRAKADLDKALLDAADLKEKLDKSGRELDQAAHELEGVREELLAEQQERARLQEVEAKLRGDITILEATSDRLTQKNAELANKIAVSQTTTEEQDGKINYLQGERTTLEVERERLRKDLEKQGEKVGELTDRVMAADGERDRMFAELQTTQIELATLRTQVQNLEINITALTGVNRELVQQRDALDRKAQQLLRRLRGITQLHEPVVDAFVQAKKIAETGQQPQPPVPGWLKAALVAVAVTLLATGLGLYIGAALAKQKREADSSALTEKTAKLELELAEYEKALKEAKSGSFPVIVYTPRRVRPVGCTPNNARPTGWAQHADAKASYETFLLAEKTAAQTNNPDDFARVATLLKVAAERHQHPEAMHAFADRLAEGEDAAVNKNKRAFDMYCAAAKSGKPESLYKLAQWYYIGRAVEKDDHRAAYYWLQALKHKSKDALRDGESDFLVWSPAFVDELQKLLLRDDSLRTAHSKIGKHSRRAILTAMASADH